MTLSPKEFHSLKLGADLVDAQRLLSQRNLSPREGASVIGAVLGLLLLTGIGVSLVNTKSESVKLDRVALIESLVSGSGL